MKTIRVVTIISWVVISLVLLGLVGWFVTGTVFGIRPAWIDRNLPFRVGIGGLESLTGPFGVVTRTDNIYVEGIDSISIDWIAGDIALRPYDGDVIQLTERAQRTLHADEMFFADISGSTLEIRFLNPAIRERIGLMPPKQLEVLIPTSLAENLRQLNVGSISGRVEIDGLSMDGLSVTAVDVGTTSGDIALSNLVSKDIAANSTSGRITVNSATADNMSLDSTSGAIEVTETRSDELELDTLSGSITVFESSARSLEIDSTSGTVRASGVFDSVVAKTLSGGITLENSAVNSVADVNSTSGTVSLSGTFHSINAGTLSGAVGIRSIIVPSSINVNTTSGSINVTVPNEGPVSVNHSSTSGRFESEVPVTLDGSGAQFTFSALSGNVRLLELD